MTAGLRSRLRADARFAERVLAWEAVSGAATRALLRAAAPRQGERLLDVGCGAGAATLPAAALVGPDGTVVGADVSGAVVEVARERATRSGAGNGTFRVADLQSDQVAGGPFDAVISQFGVMFFADPVAAFANIRTHLVPGGRLAVACWQAAEVNPWSCRSLLDDVIPATSGAGTGPGPFSLAPASRTLALLRRAGFDDVRVTSHRTSVEIAEEAVVDDVELALMGVPPERMSTARQRVDDHFAAFRTTADTLRLPLGFLIATAGGQPRTSSMTVISGRAPMRMGGPQ